MKYNFGYKETEFELSVKDHKHIEQGHKTAMKTWEQPISMDALSGVNYDKLLKKFPFHTFYCRDCKENGDDYETDGKQRIINLTTPN